MRQGGDVKYILFVLLTGCSVSYSSKEAEEHIATKRENCFKTGGVEYYESTYTSHSSYCVYKAKP